MFQWLIFSFFLCFQLAARESITGNLSCYRQACLMAVSDPTYWQNFRSIGEFRIAFEISDGNMFAQYVAASNGLLAKIEEFRKLDTIGNPPLESYSVVGSFSPTTLRYICLADQIQKMVSLPESAVIAEIGAGVGGQCYILSQLRPFSKYYFFDLPEVELLIAKVMNALHLSNTYCIPMDAELPEERIDLVISNYAFSECDREVQMEYYERIMKKADRGFIIYNQISKDNGIDSLTLNEFVQLLKNDGIRPRIYTEPLSTAPGNRLIVWNRAAKGAKS